MQSELFEFNRVDSATNLLQRDGCANYFPGIFDPIRSSTLFDALKSSLDWQFDQIYMFGKLITTKRKVAWVGDEACTYTYSGVEKKPQPWTPELLDIKCELEKIAKWRFNSCLLNLYHDGNEAMGWHSDDEKELDQAAPIASLSLGGARKFSFKHKFNKTTTSLILETGSVLVMHPPTQAFWHHSLLKTKRPVSERINLTFRSIRQDLNPQL
jgi:alkylated DNA repair dioxygenase AlkB